MHALLQESIDSSLLNAAEMMLKDFTTLFSELYGESNCTAKIHMLLHLPKYTWLWGPLWTQSAFGFESKNGDLKRNIHGKNIIHQQLIHNIDTSLTLHLKCNVLLQESPATISFTNYCCNNHADQMECIGPHT